MFFQPQEPQHSEASEEAQQKTAAARKRKADKALKSAAGAGGKSGGGAAPTYKIPKRAVEAPVWGSADEANLVALLGPEVQGEYDSAFDLTAADDTTDASNDLENGVLARAFLQPPGGMSYPGVAAGGPMPPPSGVAMQPPPVPAMPLAALFGLNQVAGAPPAWIPMVDCQPPSQLLSVGSMFCIYLQQANTLLGLLREKCLMAQPQFSSPEELAQNVNRLVMLLLQSPSPRARELAHTTSTSAQRLFGGGRFRDMTRGVMVKLQRR